MLVLLQLKVKAKAKFSLSLIKHHNIDVVGIATGYGLDDQEAGVQVPVGSRIFTSPCCPDRLWGPHNLLYNGYRAREADHSPPTSD
jgi:hypothetical protein